MVNAMNAHDAHQRARWMRPDAYRWLRPDAMRFLVPGSDSAKIFPALDRKFNPSQPRIPAGSPTAGSGQMAAEEVRETGMIWCKIFLRRRKSFD